MSPQREPETKASRSPVPPQKLAPPTTKTYSLVLLAVRDPADHRFREVVYRIAGVSPDDALNINLSALPAVLRRGLSETDALVGQFVLSCCDCIAVFLVDSVVENGSPGYLTELYRRLRSSPEFEPVHVCVRSLPAGADGDRFREQFCGGSTLACPIELDALRKKALAMVDIAARFGGVVVMHADAAGK